ncbi:hypothetical protein [Glycomyces halotolerans]
MKLRLAAGAAGAVLALTASPVVAQDEAESGGATLCDLHDSRLREASGITAAADGDGWWILPDGESSEQDYGMWILRVGADCNVRDSESIFIEHPPLDPQALSLDADGFLWAADIGEHDGTRSSIAVTQVEPGNPSNNVMYRFVYPDGLKHAEAFVLMPDGKTPLFIPAVEGQAPLYMETSQKQSEDTPMKLAGTVQLSEGGTVTGASLNAAGDKVVVRTATHAYEWDVKDGDVIQAMMDTDPLVTPLEGASGGQDITYGADGEFVTLSKVDGDDTFASITGYTPAEPQPEEPAPAEGGESGSAADDGGFVDMLLGLGFDAIIRILAAIAVVGFLVMLAGIMVIRKHRREHRAEDEDGAEMGFAREESVFGDIRADDPVDLGLDAGQPDPEVGELAKGSVYGSPKAEPGGNVYGAKRPEAEGGVYGAARSEPTPGVYGSPRSDAAPEPPAGVYGRGGRDEPQYGAFEAAGQGSIYNDVGESFAIDSGPPPPAAPAPASPPAPPPAAPPPAQQTYGTPRQAAGGVHGGAAPDAAGSVYGAGGEAGGTVYGAGGGEQRAPEPDEDYWGPSNGGGYGRGR